MVKRPRGTRDFFRENLNHYAHLEQLLKNILFDYNFQEVRTPLLEAKDLFVRGVGAETDVVSKEMYEFIDKKGRKLVLRPEGTAPAARALIENKWYLPQNLPLKLFYVGPMFRYERPQVGRYRQFDQLGVEIYGTINPYQDLELMSLIKRFIEASHLEDKVELEVNYLVWGSNRKEYLTELTTYFCNFVDLCEDCSNRIKTNPLRVLDCKIDGHRFIDLPTMNKHFSKLENEHWADFQAGLTEVGIPWKWNPQLVRGLDYYTGLVFELKFKDSILGSQNTLLAGGRYNTLVQNLEGPELPAIGFALGIDRWLLALEATKFNFPSNKQPILFTIPLTKKAAIWNLNLLDNLRKKGFDIETDLALKGLKHGFKQAEKQQAEFVMVIGEQEVMSHQVTLKNQSNGQTHSLLLAELPKFLKDYQKNTNRKG